MDESPRKSHCDFNIRIENENDLWRKIMDLYCSITENSATNDNKRQVFLQLSEDLQQQYWKTMTQAKMKQKQSPQIMSAALQCRLQSMRSTLNPPHVRSTTILPWMITIMIIAIIFLLFVAFHVVSSGHVNYVLSAKHKQMLANFNYTATETRAFASPKPKGFKAISATAIRNTTVTSFMANTAIIALTVTNTSTNIKAITSNTLKATVGTTSAAATAAVITTSTSLKTTTTTTTTTTITVNTTTTTSTEVNITRNNATIVTKDLETSIARYNKLTFDVRIRYIESITFSLGLLIFILFLIVLSYVGICQIIICIYHILHLLYHFVSALLVNTSTHLIDRNEKVIFLDPMVQYSHLHALLEENLLVYTSIHHCFVELASNHLTEYTLFLSFTIFEAHSYELSRLSNVSLGIFCEGNEQSLRQRSKSKYHIRFIFSKSRLFEHLRHAIILNYTKQGHMYHMKGLEDKADECFLAASQHCRILADYLEQQANIPNGSEPIESILPENENANDLVLQSFTSTLEH